ncbi:hypothetical protein ACWDRR_10890 [Kitasatospora sp. NPDC003701]
MTDGRPAVPGRTDLRAGSGGEALHRGLGFGEHSVPLSRQRSYG